MVSWCQCGHNSSNIYSARKDIYHIPLSMSNHYRIRKYTTLFQKQKQYIITPDLVIVGSTEVRYSVLW